jgi:hypothetical protein
LLSSRSIRQWLDRLIASNGELADLLNRKLDEANAADANLAGLLHRKLAEIAGGNANLAGLLSRKLDEIAESDANLAELLNRKLEEVDASHSHLVGLLNRKIDEIAAAQAHLADLWNRKLAEAGAGLADLVNRKLDEAARANADLVQGASQVGAERLDRLEHKLDAIVAETGSLLDQKLTQLVENMRSPIGSRPPKSLSNEPILYICHVVHEHDKVFDQNVSEYMKEIGIRCKTILLNDLGQRPELEQCFRGDALGVLGFNSQLDHSWLGSTNFLDAAAEQNIPVIQWFIDHPSSRLAEFQNSTAQNSRFIFSSGNAERYFQSYGIPGALTATVAGVGPSRHSRLGQLTFESFCERPTNCQVAFNLRRMGRTIEEIRSELDALAPTLRTVVYEAVERAYADLVVPLEVQFDLALEASGFPVPCGVRHTCMKLLEEVVQISRRQRIIEVARRFPVLIQSDDAVRPFQAGAKARFEQDVDMTVTWARLKLARAQVAISNIHDMLHERVLNGLNAGCANIVEDSAANRAFFEDGRDALFFRYDDDSLARHFDLVCGDVKRVYEVAANGFVRRDQPPFRFGDFGNFLKLTR